MEKYWEESLKFKIQQKKNEWLSFIEKVTKNGKIKNCLEIGCYDGDRYFFERDFIHFVDMLGYEPIYDDFGPNHVWKVINEQEYIENLNLWKEKQF